jgi:uncharacterized protein
MKRHAPILAVTLCLLAAPAGRAQTKAALPEVPSYVTDLANVIDPVYEQQLTTLLNELDQKAGVHYIILTVESTEGVPIEEFAINLAHDKWKLGQQADDKGLLFVLAVEQRRGRFEVGYGLEDVITDAYSGRIGREFLVPHMRQGQTSRGIYEVNLRAIQRIAAQAGVTLTGMPTLQPQRVPRGRGPGRRAPLPCCGLLPFLFVLFFVFGGRGMGWWFFLPMIFGGFGGYRGYGRSGSFGGGSFGGSFGGFGGGMGGGGFGRFGGGGGGGFGGGGSTIGW